MKKKIKKIRKLKILTEFKEFAVKGNVIDMAVGVIIGGAFSKIVTSLVNDIVMPALSFIMGRVNLTEMSVLITPFNDAAPIEIRYGAFLQNVLDFLIVAACIFFAVKMINMLKKMQEEKSKEPEIEEKPAPEPVPAPSNQELLLEEIRDILKNTKSPGDGNDL